MYKISLIVIIIGSVLFLIAAFSPASRVFGERNPDKRMEIIMGAKTTWDVVQFLFGAGAIIAAGGILLLAFQLQGLQQHIILKIAGFLLIAASIFWIWHLYLRATDPSAFAHGLQPWWHFALYTLVTQAAIAMAGYFLLQPPFATWIGWMLIISMGGLFLLTVIFRDMPPFVYYVFLIIAAVALLRSSAWPVNSASVG